MLDILSLQEEKKDLQTKINSNPENPDVPVLRAMLVSTNIQIAANKTSVRKEVAAKGSTVKKTTFPSYAKLVHSSNGKRYRQRRIVARKKTDKITPRDFHFINRVYVKLFNGEEWIVDLASLDRPYEDVMARRLAPSWSIVPFVDLYYEVRNIRTFKNKVIAKRQNQGRELRYQEGYCPTSLGL
ncbi:hypothetical protein [Listeria booriae]|uniref:Uncharacterized protein n=1 Tax=Listeria booriae TaxID=1552123 RepID=A0A841W6F8_9LIST|nr:hypothetical protein [Listeria booriae]MBC1228672.1 hypothetical protein [Listeria booriae]MBC1318460.1 hypothetical protein [Listeria booriae]